MLDVRKRKPAASPSLLSLTQKAPGFARVPPQRSFSPAQSVAKAGPRVERETEQPNRSTTDRVAHEPNLTGEPGRRRLEANEAADAGPLGSIRNLWARLTAAAPNLPPQPAPVEAARSSLPAVEAAPPAHLELAEERFWRPMIDPFAVIGAIVRAKWLILGAAVAGGAIAAALAWSTPKHYSAASELLIDPRDLKLTSRDLTEGGLPSDATLAIVENQVRVLTSGSVLGKVVQKLDLAADPEFNGTRSAVGLKGALDGLRAMLAGPKAGGPDEAGRRWTLAVQNLAEKLDVERGGKTFVIHVAATTEDPKKSALIANTMTETFLQTYGELQSDTAGRAAGELNGRLDELRKGLETAERAVETFKSQNGIVDAQGKLITDEEILKLNEQLGAARARTLELDARAASVRNIDVDEAAGGALPEGIGSSTVGELRAQYATLKSQADLLAVRLGPRHPQLLAVEAQLAGAREQLRGELRRIVSSIGLEQKRAAALQNDLSSRLTELKSRQADLSGRLVTLRELEREATTKRSVYEAYLLRAKETGEQSGINTANMSVISTAYPPLEPVGPSRTTVSLMGVIAGLGLGTALAGGWGAVGSVRTNARGRQVRPNLPAASPVQPVAAVPPPSLSLPDESDGQIEALRASLRDLHARVLDMRANRPSA